MNIIKRSLGKNVFILQRKQSMKCAVRTSFSIMNQKNRFMPISLTQQSKVYYITKMNFGSKDSRSKSDIVKDFFFQLDIDGNRVIDREEMQVGLQKLAAEIGLSSSQIQIFLDETYGKHDKSQRHEGLSLEQLEDTLERNFGDGGKYAKSAVENFWDTVAENTKSKSKDEIVKEFFMQLDTDGNGVIDREEMQSGLKDLANQLDLNLSQIEIFLNEIYCKYGEHEGLSFEELENTIEEIFAGCHYGDKYTENPTVADYWNSIAVYSRQRCAREEIRMIRQMEKERKVSSSMSDTSMQ